MTDAPAPRRRGWIDALIATALRWNERLGRPVGEDEPGEPDEARTEPAGVRRRFRSARPAPETGPHGV
jgi:hypothetical protein